MMTSEFYPPKGKLEKAHWKVIKLGDAVFSLKNLMPKLAAKLEARLEKARQEYKVIQAEVEVDRNSQRKQIERARGELSRHYAATFKAIVERDGGSCRHCQTTSNLTIDHVKALFNGGTNDLDNLQLLCRSCNSRKHKK
jgi:5-methylcytosine-specific restriction endonuclease McrA